ncbi:MAG: hypothetical protein H6550_16490 [Chitinophagales bacterium]|nr:hypothetical protein [Chitinophagales bacterium]
MVCNWVSTFQEYDTLYPGKQCPHGKLHLVFGTRKQEDLLSEEMKELEKQMET